MRVLVVNLTRFGDLLQSQSGIAALSAGGHEVGLVCLDNFAPATALLRGVEHVFPLHGGRLLKSMEAAPAISGSRDQPVQPDWPAEFGALVLWRNELQEKFAPDVVVNCTPFLSARLLSRFLAGNKPVFGFGVDANGYGDNQGQWASLLQGAKGLRGASPFNVADVFRAMMQAAVGERSHQKDNERTTIPANEPASDPARWADFLPGALARPTDESLAAMQQRLAALCPPAATGRIRGYVALQLGASEKRRQWPVASFAAIGQQCWQEHGLCPVLLGSKHEEELGLSYASCAASPFISLCGQTDLPELASALCCCKLLLTNDTGTMHLAAGLNVPVFAIFLATAQPFDTGPCLPGSFSFEPDMDCHPCAFGVACPHGNACQQAIVPEAVWPFVRTRLANTTCGPAAGVETGVSKKSGARVWRTMRRAGGMLSLESFSGHDGTDRAVWLAAQQVFLEVFLTGGQPEILEPIGLSAEGAQEAGADIATILGYMTILEKQGEVLGVRAIPAMRAKFLQSWNAVTEAMCKSRWTAALGPIWVDDTQKEGQNITQTIAVIAKYRALLGTVHSVLTKE